PGQQTRGPQCEPFDRQTGCHVEPREVEATRSGTRPPAIDPESTDVTRGHRGLQDRRREQAVGIGEPGNKRPTEVLFEPLPRVLELATELVAVEPSQVWMRPGVGAQAEARVHGALELSFGSRAPD